MARVTVEDCLKNEPNRFKLVLMAAKRARQLLKGSKPLVDTRNNKPIVIALREIAAGKVIADANGDIKTKKPVTIPKPLLDSKDSE